MLRTGLTKKLVYLGLVLCVIALALALACAAPAPTLKPASAPTTAPAPAATPAAKPAPAPTQATTAAPGKPQAQSGGTLRILNIGTVENLGYPASSLPRYNCLAPFPALENLLRYDEQGNVIPWLATGWTWSTDKKSVTLQIRKGVKFHDGTDFNAQAVKFNLDTVRNGKRTELKAITSIDVVDDYSVRINLPAYDNLLLADLARTSGPMISPTAAQKNGADWCIINPVGTGPFKFVSFKRDVSIKYEKFKDYWGQGKPYLDAIEFTLFVDAVTAKASFMAGEGDVLMGISAVDANDLKKKGKYNVVWTNMTINGLMGDSAHANSPFSNLKVRQAVSYAIDNQALVNGIGYGYMRAGDQLSFPPSWDYSKNIIGYPYNAAKAKQLLSEAGYPNGFKTKLTYNATSSDSASAFAIAQQYLKLVGIDATLEPLSTTAISAATVQGWDNGMLIFTNMRPLGAHPVSNLKLNLSQQAYKYVSAIHPDDVEAKITQAIVESDQDKMKALVLDVNKMLIDNYCVITPVFVSGLGNAQYPNVHDTQLNDPWFDNWRPENAWMSK